MEFVNVTTQAELNKAVINGDIPVCRGKGYFVVSGQTTVRAFDQTTVEASGQTTVEAFDQTTVEAFDQTTVEASGQTTVRAFGQTTVEAFGQTTVEASGQTTVRAFGQTTVRAFGQTTVRASGQTTVRAFDQTTVRAFGQTTVRAFDQTTVEAFGQTTVRAFDQTTVRASKFVAIHRQGDTPKVNGGVLIQIPPLETVGDFLDYYGVDVVRGKATVYKAVNDDWVSDHAVCYEPGTKPSCDDWSAQPRCGGGLHFSPRPFMTRRYSDGPRIVACEIKVSDAVVITDMGTPDKLKAPSCKVIGHVDEDGQPVVVEALAA